MSAGVGIEPDPVVQVQTPDIGSSDQYTMTSCFPDDGQAAREVDLEFEVNELPEPARNGPGSQNHRTWLSKEDRVPLLSSNLSIPDAHSLMVCVVWAGPAIHLRPNRRDPDPWQHCDHRLSNVGSEFNVRRKPDGLE